MAVMFLYISKKDFKRTNEKEHKIEFLYVCEKYDQESWLNIDQVVTLISCNSIEQNKIKYM